VMIFLERPLLLTLLTIAVLSVVGPFLWQHFGKRKRKKHAGHS